MLADVWNNLDGWPAWEPPLTNMNVFLHRINDPRSQLEYNMKGLPAAEREQRIKGYYDTVSGRMSNLLNKRE